MTMTKISKSKASASKAFIESGMAIRGANPAEELQRLDGKTAKAAA